MLPVLRPRRRLPLAPIRRLFSSPSFFGTGEGGAPVDAAAAAAARARAEAAARAEAYRQVQNFDWSSSADWKTAANILFTLPPKRKEFGLDFHLVQLFFVCMPSLAVYLVAQYARREIKRMEAEAEEKRKKEEVEKQKQLEEESVKEEDADSKLSKVLVRLDALEGVVKEIVDDKGKVSSSNLHNKEELIKKNGTSLKKASDLKNRASDSQVTVKSKDISGTANTVKYNTTKQQGGWREGTD
ncbi:hypothetical protein PR202_gb03798 [Eleusine coracana subsp. coracana]|uniref:Uncharacterized protein n=1 Tax=Eleusine coracana subsp. coracana TaxID=191504 RepID=A0AAV5E231_ELECO|nr:hypothetical protein QOZ80_1BG0096110 [Eleusine coracana subsp. coracana]GJN16777.1 hypothetical protein PR202_gb03798 [Eleusine coracana subsp. coracana]